MALLFVLLLFLIGFAQSKRSKTHEKLWKTRKKNCEKINCSHLVSDEAMNCVNECTSTDCYKEVYANDPLEDGEIDNARNRQFLQCVRKEAREIQREKIKRVS
jgi:hypothetical protein